MVKTTSALGISVKKRLSDITNFTSYRVSPTKSEIFQELDSPTKMYINQLLKENLFLMKQVQEKNELVELSGMELRNLRLGLQMIQLQNWQLAQTNTRMLAELNLSKEKMRALQHEIVCKDVLLKAKSLELQLLEKAGEFGCDEEADNTLQPNDDSKKYPDRKRTTRRRCNISNLYRLLYIYNFNNSFMWLIALSLPRLQQRQIQMFHKQQKGRRTPKAKGVFQGDDPQRRSSSPMTYQSMTCLRLMLPIFLYVEISSPWMIQKLKLRHVCRTRAWRETLIILPYRKLQANEELQPEDQCVKQLNESSPTRRYHLTAN